MVFKKPNSPLVLHYPKNGVIIKKIYKVLDIMYF